FKKRGHQRDAVAVKHPLDELPDESSKCGLMLLAGAINESLSDWPFLLFDHAFGFEPFEQGQNRPMNHRTKLEQTLPNLTGGRLTMPVQAVEHVSFGGRQISIWHVSSSASVSFLCGKPIHIDASLNRQAAKETPVCFSICAHGRNNAARLGEHTRLAC